MAKKKLQKLSKKPMARAREELPPEDDEALDDDGDFDDDDDDEEDDDLPDDDVAPPGFSSADLDDDEDEPISDPLRAGRAPEDSFSRAVGQTDDDEAAVPQDQFGSALEDILGKKKKKGPQPVAADDPNAPVGYTCVPQGPTGKPIDGEKVELWGFRSPRDLKMDLISRRPDHKGAWFVEEYMMKRAPGTRDMKRKSTRDFVVRTDLDDDGGYDEEVEDPTAMNYDLPPIDDEDEDEDFEDGRNGQNGRRRGNGRSMESVVNNELVRTINLAMRENREFMREALANSRSNNGFDLQQMITLLPTITEAFRAMRGPSQTEELFKIFNAGQESMRKAERPGIMEMIMPLMFMRIANSDPTLASSMLQAGAMPGMPALPEGAQAPMLPAPAGPPPAAPPPRQLPPQPPQPSQSPPQPPQAIDQASGLWQMVNLAMNSPMADKLQDWTYWAKRIVYENSDRFVDQFIQRDPEQMVDPLTREAPAMIRFVEKRIPDEMKSAMKPEEMQEQIRRGLVDWIGKIQNAVRDEMNPEESTGTREPAADADAKPARSGTT